nr:hypothetical protein [Tanacetum cinerariifolium]
MSPPKMSISLEEIAIVSPSSMADLIRQPDASNGRFFASCGCVTAQDLQAIGESLYGPHSQESKDDGLTIRKSRNQELASLILLKMDNREPLYCIFDSGWCANKCKSCKINWNNQNDGWKRVPAYPKLQQHGKGGPSQAILL